MKLTEFLALVMASVVLFSQTMALSNSCCYSFSSITLPKPGSNAAEYNILFSAAPQYTISGGIDNSISFPKTFVIAVLPKGCSYFGLYGVNCNTPDQSITINFTQVLATEAGPAKFDEVVMSGYTCTLASECPSAVASSLPSAPAQSSGVVPPVVPPGGTTAGPSQTSGSQPTNMPGGGSVTDVGKGNGGAQPTTSSPTTSSNSVSGGNAGDTHPGKSDTIIIVGSTVGAAALVLISSLVIIRRQKKAATAKAAAAAVAAAAASAASSTEGSPSMGPRDPPWNEGPSRVAAAASALWAALMDPKRMSPRIPTMTAPWNRIYLPNSVGAGAGTGAGISLEKHPQAIVDRHTSIQTASDQSSVFGILDAYTTQEKDSNWPSRENSISRNPALAAAVSAVNDLSIAAATGGIRHERIRRTGFGTSILGSVGITGGGVETAPTMVHIPDNGARDDYFEDEDDQTDYMESMNNTHEMQDVSLAPSVNVSSELTIVPEPSTPPAVPASPLLNARARLFQAVSLASSRLRQQVNRHSWYGSPVQTHAEAVAVAQVEPTIHLEATTIEALEELKPMKPAGPRYPRDNLAITRPGRTSFYKRNQDSNTNSGIFVTSIRAEHQDQQLQQNIMDTHELRVQSTDSFDFANPGPPRMPPTQPSTITNAFNVNRVSHYDENSNNISDSQLYRNNLNTFRSSTTRRGPIVMRSEEIRIVRAEPPHSAEIFPIKPPTRYSRDPRTLPTKYEEFPLYANGLYGFM
ncbi:hypothetical protein EMPS_00934 [Entomortierella parvispora]|uniref:Mid2 domain-containing protein n=1 Tax=Entomortierella parvispora TaxID=205924 RepID=A0A9P3LS42_9FUNG|nr:hypothetical protein EMPS_00934 [Entomortierella parvispora]